MTKCEGMADAPRIYLDSCCFIDIVKQKIGIQPDSSDKDVWHTSEILEAH